MLGTCLLSCVLNAIFITIFKSSVTFVHTYAYKRGQILFSLRLNIDEVWKSKLKKNEYPQNTRCYMKYFQQF